MRAKEACGNMTKPIETTVVAAIMAAVAACLDRSPESLRIRSITPVTAAGPSLWALAGRMAQMTARRPAGR